MSPSTMRTQGLRSFFPDTDSLSLRSFRLNHNTPPSPRASSLKQASLNPFRNILGSSAHTTTYQPTIEDLSRPSFDEKELLFTLGLPPQMATTMPSASAATSTTQVLQQDQTQRSRSKSKTIIRMLTKFGSRSTPISPSSPTAGKAPAASASAIAKEKRDAALRERGLLPPLSLSVQEATLDRTLPIASDPSAAGPSAASVSDADRIKQEWESKNKSADALNKKRMANFKFGGSSTSINKIPRPGGQPDSTSTDSLGPLGAHESPSTTTSLSPPPSPLRPSRTSPSEKAEPLLRSLDISAELEAFMVALPPSPSPSKLRPDKLSFISSISASSGGNEDETPAVEKAENDEASGAVTPRPPASPTTAEAAETLLALASISLSASTTTSPATPQQQQATPVISLTPPTTFVEPSAVAGCHSETSKTSDEETPPKITPEPASLSQGIPSNSTSMSASASETTAPRPAATSTPSDLFEAALISPSLSESAGSESTSSSGLSSLMTSGLSESQSATTSATTGLDSLTIKTQHGSNVPVIIESPISEWFGGKMSLEGLDVVVEEPEALGFEGSRSKLSLNVDVVGVNELGVQESPNNEKQTSVDIPKRGATCPETDEPASPTTANPPSPSTLRVKAQPQRKRGVTDPEASVKRRSVLNPFKRKDTSESDAREPPSSPVSASSPTASPAGSLAQKRTGVFSTMRRSLGGAGSRKSLSMKLDTDGSKMFDASKLPASPTLPMNFSNGGSISSSGGRQRNSSVPRERSPSRDRASNSSKERTSRERGPPRQAVAPQIYHRGSIIVEASNIEDDETRRMTEMAFLG